MDSQSAPSVECYRASATEQPGLPARRYRGRVLVEAYLTAPGIPFGK